MDWEDDSRYVKEERASNTPSSRDSIEFENKYVLKEWLMEWTKMRGMEDGRWKMEDGRGRTRNEGH